jgi:hypothetical protein
MTKAVAVTYPEVRFHQLLAALAAMICLTLYTISDVFILTQSSLLH